MNRVKFGVVADIHLGPDINTKLGTTALSCLGDFGKAVKGEAPDFLARLGDDISSVTLAQDRQRQAAIEAEFNRMAVPHYKIDGNHDRKLLPVPQQSHVQDINGFRFIFWCPNVRLPSTIGLYLPQFDIDWLEREVMTSDKPTVVFSHVPLDNDAADNLNDLRFNGFKGQGQFYPQGAQVRKILEDSKKVILCMAGHRHTDRTRTMNGIHYITLQSLTEAVPHTSPAKPFGAFGFVEIKDRDIMFIRRGAQPSNAQLKARPVI